jgi:hypothetical protein
MKQSDRLMKLINQRTMSIGRPRPVQRLMPMSHNLLDLRRLPSKLAPHEEVEWHSCSYLHRRRMPEA